MVVNQKLFKDIRHHLCLMGRLDITLVPLFTFPSWIQQNWINNGGRMMVGDSGSKVFASPSRGG